MNRFEIYRINYRDSLRRNVGEQVYADKGKADPSFLPLLYVRDVDRRGRLLPPFVEDPEKMILSKCHVSKLK